MPGGLRFTDATRVILSKGRRGGVEGMWEINVADLRVRAKITSCKWL